MISGASTKHSIVESRNIFFGARKYEFRFACNAIIPEFFSSPLIGIERLSVKVHKLPSIKGRDIRKMSG